MHLVHAHLGEEAEEGHQDVLQVQEVVGVLSHHLQVGAEEVELLAVNLEEVEVAVLLVVNLEEVEEVELLAVEDLVEAVEVEHLLVHLEAVEEVEGQDEHLEGVKGLHVHLGEEVVGGVLLGQGEEVGVGVLHGQGVGEVEGVLLNVSMEEVEEVEEEH